MGNKGGEGRKCRFFLEIEQGSGVTRYAVRPIRSDLHVRAYQLRKIGGKPEGLVYHVTQEPGGLRDCDCGARIFRDGPCKHIKAVAVMGLFLTNHELLGLQEMMPLENGTGRKGS